MGQNPFLPQNLYPVTGTPATPGSSSAPATPSAPMSQPGQPAPAVPQGLPDDQFFKTNPGTPANQAQTPPPFENPFMPGSPTDMLAGTVAGVAVGTGLTAMNNTNKEGKSLILKLAQGVERLPGAQKFNTALDNHLFQRLERQGWYRRYAYTDVTKGTQSAQQALAQTAKNDVKNILSTYKPGSLPTALTEAASPQALREAAEKAMHEATDKKIRRQMNGIAIQAKGMISSSSHPAKVDVATASQAAHVKGPLGKAVLKMHQHLNGLFNGNVAMQSMGLSSENLLGKLLGPALAGFIVFGQAFASAGKAKEGEKTKTFFHNFLGMGVGSLVGWSVGLKILTKSNIVRKTFNKVGLGNLARATICNIPKLGIKFSFGGMVTQLLAMFVLSIPFQKGFEALSHRIFGKPSQETLDKIDHKTPKQPESAGQPPQASAPAAQQTAPQPATAQPTEPAPATAPAFSVSPDQIRQNTAATNQQSTASQLQQDGWDPQSLLGPYAPKH